MIDTGRDISRRALGLSLAIYRVTDKFPAGEILIWQLRRTSNEIVAEIIEGDFDCVRKKIEIILSYFKIAQAQNWVRPINWSILDFEYCKLKQEIVLALIVKEEAGEKESASGIVSHNIERKKKSAKTQKGPLSSRQDRILEIIQNKGSVKMSDLLPLLKSVASERTLRNDLLDLVSKKLVKKEGFKKSARYYGE